MFRLLSNLEDNKKLHDDHHIFKNNAYSTLHKQT